MRSWARIVGVILMATGVSAVEPPARSHWAFVPPRQPELPQVRNRAWVRNEIDTFVLARLEKAGFAPSPEADRSALIRRLTFDLLGLPPSPEEVRAYVQDSRPDAYERLVDRLLASPHFGEQWGRHWLDLARYADSDGYEKDGVRPYAYLYRDWVIDAINRDMTFDQFTIEQLAGDLLPDATLPQKTATGFHRQTLTNKEGGVDQEEFRCKATVDRVSTTATVWLGLTLGCAECHNHKYDPLTQREFYEMYAFFNNASEKDVSAARPEELARHGKKKQAWDAEQERLQAAWDTAVESDPPAQWAKWEKELTAHAKKEPKSPETKAAVLEETLRTTHVHVRGDFLRQGPEVHPGVPAILPPLPAPGGSVAHTQALTRLDLAHWLVDRVNPLTARVTVNHVWRHLFGRGLVPTVNDFGTRGARPTHPELLDWLALAFVSQGTDSRGPALSWSRKGLIRLIVTSATYRQSSIVRPDLAERDPLNELWARQNRFRLDAENIRDAGLVVSGLLHPAIGGPSVHPPLPADIAAVGYAGSIRWKESEGADRYRRGLYIFFQRTVPYPMLTTFDAPDSNGTCPQRERSDTPLQALTLWNDSVFVECAQALGRRLVLEGPADAGGRIRLAFERCLSRPPSLEEAARLAAFFEGCRRLLQTEPAHVAKVIGTEKSTGSGEELEQAALVAVARTILNLDEFVTRE